jgi:hypothetical protein
MPKFILLILSLAIIAGIAGCNLPVSTISDPNELATQVSDLLTSTPMVQSSPTDAPSSENLIETSEQDLITETPQVTDTIEATIESTATPTTLPLDLPEGTPAWSDPFENGTRFGINDEGYDDGQTRILISDGAMVLTSITGSGWRGWRLTSQKPSSYYLEADFSTEECSGSDQYGLVVQSPDYASGFGYYFGLTCDGRYAFQKWEESGLSNLQGWETDSNVNAGSNQNNSIGILKSGNQYDLYVNDVKIIEIEDEKYSTPGYFGPFIAGVNTTNFTVKLTNISYWNIP